MIPVAPLASVEWTADSDAGYYMDADAALGIMRFLFSADIGENKVTESGIKYIKGSNITDKVAGLSGTGTSSIFYGDIINIPEEAQGGTYYAAAYVKVGGETYWSDVVACEPSFNKHFTSLDKTEGEAE